MKQNKINLAFISIEIISFFVLITSVVSANYTINSNWNESGYLESVVERGNHKITLDLNISDYDTWYDFLDGSSNVLWNVNRTGLMGDGNISGNPVWINDGGLNFDGTNDHIVTKNPRIDLTSGTIFTNATRTGNTTDDLIIGIGFNPTNERQFLMWFDEASIDYPALGIHDGSSWTVSYGTTPIVSGTEYSVGFEYNSGVSKLIINGVQENTITKTMANTNKDAWIGEQGDSSKDLDGKIYKIIVYKRTMSTWEWSELSGSYKYKTSGNFTSWHNSGLNNSIYRLNINFTSIPLNTNYTVYYRQNNTGEYIQIGVPNNNENQTIDLPTSYQNIDVIIQLFGNIMSTPQLDSIIFFELLPEEQQGFNLTVPEVGLYNIHNINLNSTNNYNNLYIEVNLSVNFTKPDGTYMIIYGFWDGGNNWKVRMAPTQIGYWNYTTISTDSSLNGISGSINATVSGKKGFTVRNPNNNYSFMKSYSNESILLFGDTNWNMFSTRNGNLTNSIFKLYIDNRSSQKINFIRGYINPFYISGTDWRSNEGGFAFNPWNPDNLSVGYFQEVDNRIEYMNSKNISAHLVFGADGTTLTTFFGWNNGKMERYIKYVVARYGSYDVSWEGRAEFEEQGTTTPGYMELARQIGNWTREFDPYNHVQSIHTLDSNRELSNDEWLDWIMQQSTSWSDITTDLQYNKPVMNEEFYYENSGYGATNSHHVDSDTVRKGAWKIMTYGGSGLAFGNTGTINSRSMPFGGLQYSISNGTSYIKYLLDFWNSTDYINLTPTNNIRLSGASDVSIVQKLPGKQYVIYMPSGGSVTLNLSNSSYLNSSWYNTRTGVYQNNSFFVPNSSYTIISPDNNDWAVLLTEESKELVPYSLGWFNKTINVNNNCYADKLLYTNVSSQIKYIFTCGQPNNESIQVYTNEEVIIHIS